MGIASERCRFARKLCWGGALAFKRRGMMAMLGGVGRFLIVFRASGLCEGFCGWMSGC